MGFWLHAAPASSSTRDARVRLGAGWEAFANVDNLFNRRSSNFATLGRNVFTAPVAVAQNDIERFKESFPMKARPLQPIHRRILLTN